MERGSEGLRVVREGMLLGLVTLLFGFVLGGLFGGIEDVLKARLHAGGESYLASLDDAERESSTDKVAGVVKKSWTYMKRAHLHANGLGTATIALVLLLARIRARDGIRRLVAAGMGVGSLGYSVFWLLAALRAPGLGSTGAAKASLEWLAIPSAALCLLSVTAVLALFARDSFSRAD